MSLSTHELMLVLRARDEASRVLGAFGAQMTTLDRRAQAAARRQMTAGAGLATVGVGIAAAGIAGIAALNSMTDAAAAYDQQAARTLTQVDKVKISFQEIKDMGRDTATHFAVDFDAVQQTLYDIFSSIDTNAPGAQKLLNGIALAAVGGDVSMSDAGKGLIGILNAYKMKATDVNKVNDVMFQLVRKGVGTYAQFDSTIGRAVPSAVKAGQSIEALAGMMAFLTRNGLSTAMASASAARALDALSNPVAVDNFKQFGVEIYNAGGKMRPVVDIMESLRQKMKGMTQEQKAATLHDLFHGAGGTIQAMRFFNHGINDSNNLLGEMTTAMDNSKGAAQGAYDIMKNTPENKIKLLNNRYQAMKTIIGDQLLPIKLKLIDALSKLLGMWNSLNPRVQKFIVYAIAIASAVAVVVGIVMSVVGVFLMLGAAAAMAGVSLGAIVLIGGAIIIGLAAIGVGVYLLIKHWDEVKAKTLEVWHSILPVIMAVVDYVKGDLVNGFNKVVGFLIDQWNKLYSGVSGPIHSMVDSFMSAVSQIKKALDDFTKGMSSSAFIEAATHVWHAIVDIVQYYVWPILSRIIILLRVDLVAAFHVLAPIVSAVFHTIADIISAFLKILSGIIKLVVDLINGDWSKAWHDCLQIVRGIWDLIVAVVRGAWNILVGIVKGIVDGIINWFEHLYDVLVGHSIIPDLINAIIHWFSGLPGKILKALGNIGNLLYDAGKHILEGLMKGLDSMASSAMDKAKNIASGIGNAAKHALGISSPSKVFYDIGVNIIQGLNNGLARGQATSASFENRISSFIARMKQLAAAPHVALGAGKHSPSTVQNNSTANAEISAVAKRASLLGKQINNENNLFIKLTNQRLTVAGKLKYAQGLLTNAMKLYTDMRDNVKAQILQSFDITKFFNIDDATQGLQDALTKAQTFAADINKLKTMGLNQTELSALVTAGPNQAFNTVEGLVNATQDQIDTFNSLYKQFDQQAGSAGISIADTLYGAGVRAAQGLVNGLASQEVTLTKMMTRLAGAMVSAIKKALGIKSPSQVFHNLGVNVGMGFVNGLISQQANAKAATLGMIASSSSLAASSWANTNNGVQKTTGGAPQVIFQEGAIQTQEIDPVTHAADLGWHVSRRLGVGS